MLLIQRIKRLFLAALTAASLWTAPVLAAGTTPLALVPQVDSSGNVAAGCQLYFYVAGTVASPQNSYSDFGLTQVQPNPLPCDQSGRVPMHWLADGLIHIRLIDSFGTSLVDTTMQVLGPSSGGGGGGGTVDPTTVLATGDLKVRYGTGPLSGWVRANGLTIGNATSGATERANADTQALFVYLYAYPSLPVSGGRSGNALNDFNASKTIGVPDWRGRTLAGLDDMGNTPAGVLTSATTGFGTDATVLGAPGGNQSQTIATPNLPPYTPSGSVSTSLSLSGSVPNVIVSGSGSGVGGGGAFGVTSSPSVNFTGSSASSSFSGTAQGGASTPFSLVQPTRLATIYMKL